MPLKAMVFIDGNWLYRNRTNIFRRLEDPGACEIDYGKLPKAMVEDAANAIDADIDIVRTFYFGSMRVMMGGAARQNGFYEFLERQYRYEIHIHSFAAAPQFERQDMHWINMELAAEMLAAAHSPGAFDIAVLAGDDLDYAPVLRKVRSAGKRVILASVRPDGASMGENRRLAEMPRTCDFPCVFLDDCASSIRLVRAHTVRKCLQCGREEETTWAGHDFYCEECRGKFRSAASPVK